MKIKMSTLIAASIATITVCYMVLRSHNNAPTMTTISAVKSETLNSPREATKGLSRAIEVVHANPTILDPKNALHERIEKFSQRIRGMSFTGDILLFVKHHPEMHLTSSQIEQVQEIYNSTQEERLIHEGSLAKVVSVENDRIHVLIPTYSAKGKEIESDMYKTIATSLGSTAAMAIGISLGAEISREMKGFGMTEQHIFATREPSGVFDIVHVTTNQSGVKSSVTSRLKAANLDKYIAFTDLINPRS